MLVSEIKYAEVTVRIRLPYSEDDDGKDYNYIKNRAKNLESDEAFLASWYDFDYNPEAGNVLRTDAGITIKVSVDP